MQVTNTKINRFFKSESPVIKLGSHSKIGHVACRRIFPSRPLKGLILFVAFREHQICQGLQLEAGADVILGSHPHVIEPMQVMNIAGKNKFVIYSMGNFISAQNGLERNSGIVLNLKFHKDFGSNITTLTEVSYVPTYSHSYQSNDKLQYRVVPVADTIQKIKDGTEPFLTAQDLPTLEQVLDQTDKMLGTGFNQHFPDELYHNSKNT